MASDQSLSRAGLLYGLGAYLLWGFLPLYFKLLTEVPPSEIVAHRIIWSVLFLAILATFWRRWPAIRAAMTTSRVLMTLTVTAFLIAVNWLVYIWAVINGHVLAGSLGYYLNPLVNVLLGVVLLKEKLSRGQIVAVIGVGSLATVLGDGLAGELDEGIPVVLVEGGAHDLDLGQQAGLEQVQHPGEQLALGQVAGCSEEDDGRGGRHGVQPAPCRCGLRTLRRNC